MLSARTHLTAKNVWVACVQVVGGVWAVLVQVMNLSHNQNTHRFYTQDSRGFVHGLYHICTQRFTTAFGTKSPLLASRFYTLSTQPINITTTYINSI